MFLLPHTVTMDVLGCTKEYIFSVNGILQRIVEVIRNFHAEEYVIAQLHHICLKIKVDCKTIHAVKTIHISWLKLFY